LSYDVTGHGEIPALGSGMRALISKGRTAYGGWCMIPGAFAAEIVSASGCDWICIDQQHGLIDDAAMRVMVQATAIRRTPTLVRVPWNEPASIMRALDAGADGVIVPMVNSAEDARQAAFATRYPPGGYRSWGALRSGMASRDFNPGSANSQCVCLVMIETADAVDNLDAILDVPGVDGALVGPNDLSISHSGDTAGAASSQRDVEMITQIGEGCHKRGLAGAISGISLNEVGRWAAAGFNLIGLPSDAAVLGRGLKEAVDAAHGPHTNS
jgi:4-hydroxy-2-oxoheptanedioate aldolase